MDTNTSPRDQYAIALGDRIRQSRRGMTRETLAARLELHLNTVGKFERGVTIPDAYQVMRIAQVCECSLEWLITGDLRQASATRVQRSTRAVELGEYIYIPHFDLQMSAGQGTEMFRDVDQVIAMRPFDTHYVRHVLGISHNEIALASVIGRSMEPLLHSGDMTMLDLRARDVLTEGIHAIRLDGAALVKSLQRLPNRVLRVSSANPEFDPFDIDMSDELAQRDFAVLGRVKWAAGVVA